MLTPVIATSSTAKHNAVKVYVRHTLTHMAHHMHTSHIAHHKQLTPIQLLYQRMYTELVG